jgi:hypothetical protein
VVVVALEEAVMVVLAAEEALAGEVIQVSVVSAAVAILALAVLAAMAIRVLAEEDLEAI